jgi:dTMP kinase
LSVVTLDGVDGTGKSTLLRLLSRRIPHSIGVPEFSDSEIGKFLQDQVRKAPHFIARSELAQTLLFLAEHVERIESAFGGEPVPDDALFIVERGWLSKYSYQVCVLERTLPQAQASSLVKSILDLLPVPDASILLRVNQEVMTERLAERKTTIDPQFIAFVSRADQIMYENTATDQRGLVIDTSNLTPDEVADIAVPFCLQTAPRPRRRS